VAGEQRPEVVNASLFVRHGLYGYVSVAFTVGMTATKIGRHELRPLFGSSQRAHESTSGLWTTCRALPSVKTEDAKPVFCAPFREVEVPGAIRTNNGDPFASTPIHGLCGLSVWWMQLSVVHHRC
jgi:hypothetical protein